MTRSSSCISVGEDVVDGEARQVGPGGTDILYWPPVLSLKRERRGVVFERGKKDGAGWLGGGSGFRVPGGAQWVLGGKES